MSGFRPGPGKPVGTIPGLDVATAARAARIRATEIELPTAEDTRELGRWLAGLLRPGDLVVLAGPLGAGKTTFAQGVGAGLGVHSAVTSPTFVIAREHPDGRIPLVHVDAYRLSGVGEVDDLDLDTEAEDAVTLVEWGVGKVEKLAEEHLVVRLSRDSEPDSERRTVVFEPHGRGWVSRLVANPR